MVWYGILPGLGRFFFFVGWDRSGNPLACHPLVWSLYVLLVSKVSLSVDTELWLLDHTEPISKADPV